MPRLTNEMRLEIAKKAMADTRAKTAAELRERQDRLARAGHAKLFDAKLVKEVMKLPKEWRRMDGCLKFNADGWQVQFNLLDPRDHTKLNYEERANKDWQLPVPLGHSSSQYSCNPLGSITGELATEMQKCATDIKTFKENGDEGTKMVKQMLGMVNTIKRLKEVWPEGIEFYQEYDVPETQLPAVRMDEINALLGITAKAPADVAV